jgi:hypothetical protein
MRTRIVMEENYSVCQHSTPFVLNGRTQFFGMWVSQYTSDVTVAPCCMNSTISTPFLSQRTVAISFVAGRQRLFKLFGLFGECVCIQCVDYSLVSTFTNFVVGSLNKIITHSRWPANQFALHREHLFSHL